MTESEVLARSIFTRYLVALLFTIFIDIVVLIATNTTIWIWFCAVLLGVGGIRFGRSRARDEMYADSTTARTNGDHFVTFLLFGILAVIITVTNFFLAQTGAPDGVWFSLAALVVASISFGQSSMNPAGKRLSSH